MTMAKGLTARYLPLGAVGMRQHIAEHFQDNVFYGGLTYNSHPMGCAAALATHRRLRRGQARRERAPSMGKVIAELNDGSKRSTRASATCATSACSGWSSSSARARRRADGAVQRHIRRDEAIARYFRDNGLYTFVRWNNFFTNPPLWITEEELAEGFAIIDKASTSPTGRSASRAVLNWANPGTGNRRRTPRP